MFDNLSDKLARVFKNMRGEGRLSAENMEAALREVRVALLEADVNFKVVKQLIESVKERAMGQEVLALRSAVHSKSSASSTTSSRSKSSAATNRNCVFPTIRPASF